MKVEIPNNVLELYSDLIAYENRIPYDRRDQTAGQKAHTTRKLRKLITAIYAAGLSVPSTLRRLEMTIFNWNFTIFDSVTGIKLRTGRLDGLTVAEAQVELNKLPRFDSEEEAVG
jgi:hypothetical protein